MLKASIILLGTILLLWEQIQKVKQERTARTIALLVVSIAMVISAVILFVGEFV
jgi:Co/Zn/Cd efflux system component